MTLHSQQVIRLGDSHIGRDQHRQHQNQNQYVVVYATQSLPRHKQPQQQHRTKAQNIEMAISNFHIEFDRKEGYLYKPGDVLSGKVLMEIWSPIEICFLELVIKGKGSLSHFKTGSTFSEKPTTEHYLEKRIILLSAPSNSQEITLEAGRYESRFTYKIPESVPPSVSQTELPNGTIFDITYTCQAQVCDNFQSRNAPKNLVKILKATKKVITVVADDSWKSLPSAKEVISHSEQVMLFCAPFSSKPASVLINLNKGVYSPGERISLNVEILIPRHSKVSQIKAEIEKTTTIKHGKSKRNSQTLIKAVDDMSKHKKEIHQNMIRSGFSIPVMSNFVPSYLPKCSLLDIHYTVKLIVNFRYNGGKLVMRIPIVITAKTKVKQEIKESTTNMPVFNKPVMQFPYFSKSPSSYTLDETDDTSTLSRKQDTPQTQNGTVHNMNGDLSKKKKKERNVTTKYQSSTKCCNCCMACFGLGIYQP